MKKIIPIIIALLISCNFTIAQTFFAINPEGDTIYYAITDAANLTAKVVAGPRDSTYCDTLTIPATADWGNKTFNITAIGEKAFYQSPIVKLTMPNTITTIEKSAFSTCMDLEEIQLSKSITSIGESAFYFCNLLRTVDIPQMITTIEPYTFSGCTSLDSIHIPYSVTTINQNAFYNCISLSEIKIPDNVTYIGKYAFWCCFALEKLTLGKSIQTIESMAFANTTGLDTIYWNTPKIPHYNYIDEYGDYHHPFTNSHIRKIVFGDQVKDIPNFAFKDFTTLESIELGTSVKSIGKSAFEGCILLGSITSKATNPPSLGLNAFQYVHYDIPVFVVCEAVSAYESANGWNNFNNITCDTSQIYITAISNNDEWGVVWGGGVYDAGEEVILTADPNEGYLFEYWHDGEIDSNRTITVRKSRVYIASFRDASPERIESPELAAIKVYPNPTMGIVHLSCENIIRTEIFNIMGTKVAQFNAQSTFDISHLGCGIYNLRITTPYGTTLRKLIKQ